MEILSREFLDDVFYRLKRPKLFVEGVNVMYYKALSAADRLPEGVDVMEQEWDNLLILDACRYDAFAHSFANRESLEGDLSRVRSKAPYTNEFLRQNIHGRKLHDTVYITSSPHIYKSNRGERREIDADFHDIIHTWEKGNHPEDLVEDTIKAAEKYPNKRLIIHFIPPHWPFLGAKGKQLFDLYAGAPWKELVSGELSVDRSELWEAYKENLELALGYVEDLLPELTGKSVVTADHGQLLGDREFPIPIRGYGHPGLYVSALVEVPWLEVPYDERRKITSAAPESVDRDVDEAVVEDRLADLGYMT